MTEAESRKLTGQERTEDTADQAQQMTQQVQEKAGQAVQQAQQQATSLAKSQKTRASQSLGQVSQALQQAGQQLQKQGESMPGQVLTQTAQQVDRFSGYLDSHSVQDMVGEVEDFGRRKPAIFLGLSVAAGFALSRFLRSTPPSSQPEGSGGSGGQ